jgi:Viral BACON domain
MQKYLCYLLLIASTILLNSACKKSGEDDVNLVVSPTSLDFNVDKSFAFINLGTYSRSGNYSSTIDWKVTSIPKWLTLETTEGNLTPDIYQVQILCYVNDATLPIGSYSGKIVFESQSAKSVELTVNYNVDEFKSKFLIFTEKEKLFYKETDIKFAVFSNGNLPVDWYIDNPDPKFEFSTTSGKLGYKEFFEVKVKIVKNNFDLDGENIEKIVIKSKQGQIDTLKFIVDAFTEKKWFVDPNIIDAAYSNITHKVYAIENSPDKFHELDPSTKKTASVKVPDTPLCMATSFKTAEAAVGCLNKIYLIDLNNMSIKKEFIINGTPFDMTFAGNGYLYVTKREGSFSNSSTLGDFICINTQNGIIAKLPKTEMNTYTAWNPVQNCLYNTPYIPSSGTTIQKFDISNGVAVKIDEVKNKDSYQVGRVQFSADGLKMYGQNGKVYHNAKDAKDMTLINFLSPTPLPYGSFFSGMGFNTKKNSFYGIAINKKNSDKNFDRCFSYDNSTLSQNGTLPIQKFVEESTHASGYSYKFNDIDAQYLFIDENSQKAIILLSNFGSNITKVQWAIQEIKL